MSDDETYDKLIAMWDKREYLIDLKAQEDASDLIMEVYNDTGADKERTVRIIEKALEAYNEYAAIWSALSRELEELKEGEGMWGEEEEDEEDEEV